MKQELMDKTEEWMKLERKTLTQRAKAEAFYEHKLMKLIEAEFKYQNQKKVYERVEYLIMSVGTSYEPLVLNISLQQPKQILFLYTEGTEKYLNKVVKYCKLEVSDFQKKKVSETDPVDVYREIKNIYLEWNKPERMYIDFTGGTKAMAAAAAMAGALINVQLVYIGMNDYLVDFRKPMPGSEQLYYISNPLEIFGDLEIEKAMELFDKYNYAGAREKLEELKERVPDPNIRQQLNFVYLLAVTYEHWDAMEFEEAYQTVHKLNNQLKRDKQLHNKFLMMDFLDILFHQEDLLKSLMEIPKLARNKSRMEILQNKDYVIPLMFTMYTNASIREKQEKYDMATLLLYRLLELIEQRRLSLYNLDVSKMDYLNVAYNYQYQPALKKLSPEKRLDMLKQTVMKIKYVLFGKTGNGYLMEQVSLLDGFILLLALQDDIFKVKEVPPIDKLKRIRSMVFLRNNSIFAHGLGPVPARDFQKFKSFVAEEFQEFCKIEKLDFHSYMRNMTWLNPVESENYAKLGE